MAGKCSDAGALRGVTSFPQVRLASALPKPLLLVPPSTVRGAVQARVEGRRRLHRARGAGLLRPAGSAAEITTGADKLGTRNNDSAQKRFHRLVAARVEAIRASLALAVSFRDDSCCRLSACGGWRAKAGALGVPHPPARLPTHTLLPALLVTSVTSQTLDVHRRADRNLASTDPTAHITSAKWQR